MKAIIIITFLFAILSASCFGANIHGTVYDMSLSKVSNAIVEIDTTPKQRMVSVNGSYSFNIPLGNYKITSSYSEDGITIQRSEENISIIDNGNYVLDLFLFIDISEEETLLEDVEIDITIPYKRPTWHYFIVVLILLLLITGVIAYNKFYKQKRIEEKISKKEDKDLSKIILILKKQGGRATQKDLRKEIPLSEAKISLMISELESEGKIKRVKKGRGNIIILQ